METATQAAPVSKKMLWTGRIMSAVVVLFLLFDSTLHLLKPPQVLEAFVRLGYPENLSVVIASIELVCIVLYVIPGTSVLGAILLTGYLGGAVASHLRVGSPLFSEALFPIYFGVLVWGGLYGRDARLRALIPLRS
ncbi:MAG TPA: DoxX family protein [Candidatus Acidoferrales bacterium]|nr:DoxX family protein [Candidatus Acidoferrales bacterium]